MDTEETLRARIRALEEQIAPLAAQIAPLEAELKPLRSKLKAIVAGKKSGEARQQKAASRDEKILKLAEERSDDKYRRGGGMINSIAKEVGVSTRKVSDTVNKK